MKRVLAAGALALAGCGGGGGVSLSECVGGPNVYGGAACVSETPGQSAGPASYSLNNANLWVNPSWDGKQYKRLLVVAAIHDPDKRRAVEEAFVARMKAQPGVAAYAGYHLAGIDPGKLARAKLFQALAKSGADAVIFVRVTNADTEALYMPNTELPVAAGAAPEFGNDDAGGELYQPVWGVYNPMWATPNELPPAAPEITTITLQAQLVRIAKPAVIFVGTIKGPPLNPDTVAAAAGTMVAGMQLKDIF